MTAALIRGVLAAMAVTYGILATRVYLSRPAPPVATLAQVQAPLRWAPHQPIVWEQIGRHRLYDSDRDARLAEEAFRAAAKENAMEPDVWTSLADAYLQMGDPTRAESALRTAQLVYPRGPSISWRLANSLVLSGRAQEALPHLRIFALADPGQARAAYTLAWKLLESAELVLREVVPKDLDARAAYLGFLLDFRGQDATSDIWQELLKNQHPDTAALGSRLAITLLTTSRAEEASRVWQDLLVFEGRAGARPAGTLMTNGDFESDLPGTGLDWYLQKDPRWTFTLDNFAACSRSRSLLISFEGKTNHAFDGLSQMVVVQPNQDYQLRACIRTDNIVSDTGFQLAVMAAYTSSSEAFTVMGPAHLGSETWVEDTLRFRTGAHTRVVRVWLHRELSRKLYGQLRGRVWVDNFRIEPAGSGPGTGK